MDFSCQWQFCEIILVTVRFSVFMWRKVEILAVTTNVHYRNHGGPCISSSAHLSPWLRKPLEARSGTPLPATTLVCNGRRHWCHIPHWGNIISPLVLSLVLRHLISFQCLASQNLTPLEQHAKPALLVNKIEVGAVWPLLPSWCSAAPLMDECSPTTPHCCITLNN